MPKPLAEEKHMTSLTFYTNPMSRGRIVRWMLEEVGQPYETVVLDYATTMKGADYLAINPMGKVPAIRHGDVIVTETAAICAYLADAFPDAKLAPPPGDKLRGPYYRWMFYGAGPVEAMASNQALGVAVPDEKRATVGYGSREQVIDTSAVRCFARRLSGRRHLHCGRSLSRRANRLGLTVRHDRKAAGLRSLRWTDFLAASGCARS
jgi:hypothetical protein